MYTATRYEGRPAVLDTRARVYYFGFRTMRDAEARARELNAPETDRDREALREQIRREHQLQAWRDRGVL